MGLSWPSAVRYTSCPWTESQLVFRIATPQSWIHPASSQPQQRLWQSTRKGTLTHYYLIVHHWHQNQRKTCFRWAQTVCTSSYSHEKSWRVFCDIFVHDCWYGSATDRSGYLLHDWFRTPAGGQPRKIRLEEYRSRPWLHNRQIDCDVVNGAITRYVIGWYVLAAAFEIVKPSIWTYHLTSKRFIDDTDATNTVKGRSRNVYRTEQTMNRT